jgi:hypothetical protein
MHANRQTCGGVCDGATHKGTGPVLAGPGSTRMTGKSLSSRFFVRRGTHRRGASTGGSGPARAVAKSHPSRSGATPSDRRGVTPLRGVVVTCPCHAAGLRVVTVSDIDRDPPMSRSEHPGISARDI